MEHVISDECLSSIRRTCYKAGASGREVYTSRGPDGPEVVRCRDCKYAVFCGAPHEVLRCRGPLVSEATKVDSDGFCSWGRKAER